MISLGWGSWKTRLISAWPLFRDLRWKLAGLPCLQKLVTWDNRCWARQWAVGVHCADQGPPGPGAGDILVLGEGLSLTAQSPLGSVSATSLLTPHHVIRLCCLPCPCPPPHDHVLAEVDPRQRALRLHLPEVIPIVQALERGGRGVQQQVTAKVEKASFDTYVHAYGHRDSMTESAQF